MVSGVGYNLENPMNFVPSESCFTANIKPEKNCQFFNDNQLLSESSLAIPVECLSRKSMCIIVNALTEDLQAAKSRIAELEENLNGLKVQCSKGQFQDDMTGKCKSCRSMEDSCSKPSLSKTVATLRNKSREILGKSSTDELLCRFCSSRHQRGKTNCPAWNHICNRCNLPNHFASSCKTNLKKRFERLNLEEPEDHNLRKTQSCSDSTKLDLQTQADEENRIAVENQKSKLGQPLKSRRNHQISNEKSTREDFGAKHFQKTEMDTSQLPCLWCSRRTKYRCIKCAKVYCSRRCTFSDPMHNDSCNFAEFCAHCAENGGYCDIHTVPNSEPKESEQESGDNPVPTLNEKYNENKERVWIL